MSNLGEGGEYSPVNLKYCKEAYYNPDNNYICIECIAGYILNNITHLCDKKPNVYCTIGNVGTELIPKYDCTEWNRWGHNYILLTNENGEKWRKRIC